VAADALVDVIHFNAVATDARRYRRNEGSAQLRALAGTLSAQHARRVVVRMGQVRQCRLSYAQWVAQTKPHVLYELSGGLRQWDFLGRDDLRWSGYPRMGPTPLDDRARLTNLFYAWTVPNARAPGAAERYLSECIRVAQQPVSAHVPYPRPPGDCCNWARFGWDERDKDGVRWALGEFQHDCLMLTLALHGYHKEHHHYPSRLEELVADRWVKQVPVDPFTLRGAICYRTVGPQFTLYSVGPDGKDDGGKPILNASPAVPTCPEVQWPRRVRIESRGDVVYGSNDRAQDNSNWGRL
jgi:hypothetical protein